jgi:hypothetical protein
LEWQSKNKAVSKSRDFETALAMSLSRFARETQKIAEWVPPMRRFYLANSVSSPFIVVFATQREAKTYKYNRLLVDLHRFGYPGDKVFAAGKGNAPQPPCGKPGTGIYPSLAQRGRDWHHKGLCFCGNLQNL